MLVERIDPRNLLSKLSVIKKMFLVSLALFDDDVG